MLTLLVGAALLLAFAGLGASAQISCRHADEARNIGLFVQSANEYASILKKEPQSHCGQVGMQTLCNQALGLKYRHFTEEASDLYKAMVNHEPGR
ncbi:MAG TPA: hypothetical protein VHV28_16290, partial [Solirubrobacteraceae bacterium]|nr:hypothetical protein [Solirubrobacteraceae bacterium]